MKWKHYSYLAFITVGLWWVGSLVLRVLDGSNISTILDCYIHWRCFIT